MQGSLRDRLWLWCHPAGSHTRSPDQHGLPGRSALAPAEAAAFMGIPNVLFVRYELDPQPPFEVHARPLTSLNNVIWSIEGGGGGDVDAVLALARTLPSLRGVILDDYFARVVSADAGNAADGPFSLKAMQQLRARLDACRPRLDAWVVLYAHEFAHEAKLRPHLDLVDVVTLWTWTAAELVNLEKNFEQFEQIVGDKRKVLGVYLWDYGAKRSMPVSALEQQCSLGLQWLQEGRIDGMIFLASCICDLGLEAVAWAKTWISSHPA